VSTILSIKRRQINEQFQKIEISALLLHKSDVQLHNIIYRQWSIVNGEFWDFYSRLTIHHSRQS